MSQFVYNVDVSHKEGVWDHSEFYSASELSLYLETIPHQMDVVGDQSRNMVTLINIIRQEVVPSDHPKLIDS